MSIYQTRTLALFTLVGIAVALLVGMVLLVNPAYAAAPGEVDCPANGDGSEEQLKAVIVALRDMTTFDSILIRVTGSVDCVFTLTDAAGTTENGPYGLPPISRDVLIRAVGGRAIIERGDNAPDFRLMESTAKLTLENITLRNGAAKFIDFDHPASGGAVYAHQALTLTNVVITGNVSYRGGAIYAEGPLVMDQVTADHNQTLSATPSDGGAIFVAGNLTASNITVTHNVGVDCGCGSDKARGGGIFVVGNASISNALFQDNRTVREEGGGLYVTGDLTMTNGAFIGNSAGLVGGGAYVSGTLKLSNSFLVSNTSASDGGGVYVNGAASISETRFISNVAGGFGGGLYTGMNRNVMVQANLFISNQAAAGGGAAITFGVVQNNLFKGNLAKSPGSLIGGGGLLVVLKADVQNNGFVDNSAATGGGAQVLFFPIDGVGASWFINNLFIDNNATQSNGSAIAAGVNIDQFHGNFVRIIHNTIARQTREDSSAIYIVKSSADIYNNVITQSRVAVHASDSAVIGNANLFGPMTANYIGIIGGAGDLTAEPLFVDAAHNDYHLQPASPARDSGMNLGIAVDFDGISRAQGKGFDRGAFEFVNRAPVAQSETYTTAMNTPLVVAVPGVLANDGDPDGEAVTVTVLEDPVNGDLILRPTGAFIYTPTAIFTGTDSFTYQASDGLAPSAVATVTINVVGDETAQSVEIAGLQATNDGPATVGSDIHFVSIVEAGSSIHFLWDFGDGVTAEGATTSHAYAESGDYTVTLTASNRLGSKEATTTVTIQPARQQEQQKMSLPLLMK